MRIEATAIHQAITMSMSSVCLSPETCTNKFHFLDNKDIYSHRQCWWLMRSPIQAFPRSHSQAHPILIPKFVRQVLLAISASTSSNMWLHVKHDPRRFHYWLFLEQTQNLQDVHIHTLTSPGHDSIPYWVFKHCAMELTPVVTVLFNTILQTGTPPSSWKTALVTPVPKTAEVKTFSDLRPISVTPILSRLVEKLVVRKYIIPALPADLIADQFAYRPTGSTTSALISLIHSVTQKLESCTYSVSQKITPRGPYIFSFFTQTVENL